MAYRLVDTWSPNRKSRQILDRAREHIDSVGYQVSVRWVFYRLLQEGLYHEKKDYNCFIGLASRARHNGLWHPTILADETRSMVEAPVEGMLPSPNIIEALVEDGIAEAQDDLEYYRSQLSDYQYSCSYTIDPNHYLDRFVVVLFEARAMTQQFQTYTQGLTLCPFGGQPSIPLKYEIAQYLDRSADRYGKPLTVLYFGDADNKGIEIWETGRTDIQKWCEHEIEFVRCGLTQEQVERYEVPENPERPGSYQWEALSDDAAREIISNTIKQFIDVGEARKRAWKEELAICEHVNASVNDTLSATGDQGDEEDGHEPE